MKFQFRKTGLLFLSMLMIACFFGCGSSRQGGVSAPRKRSHKKCDCPKWTNNSLQIKYIDKRHA